MMKKIFIDGSAGTTGLRIRERLADRGDLEVTEMNKDKLHLSKEIVSLILDLL